jgi:hypothetical protein
MPLSGYGGFRKKRIKIRLTLLTRDGVLLRHDYSFPSFCINFPMETHDAKLWLKKKVLRQNKLFSELDDTRLDFLIGYAQTKLLSEDEYLYRKGAEADDTFCIIIFGSMNIIGDHGTVVAVLKSGAILGEIGIIGLYNKRTADVVAAEPTSILEWTFSAINEKAPYLLPKLKQAALQKLSHSRR